MRKPFSKPLSKAPIKLLTNHTSSPGFLLAIPAVFTLALFPSACFFSHKPPAAFTPPPPQSAPVFAEPEHLPDPPLVAALDLSASSVDPHIVPNGVPEAPAPPAPKPTPPRRNPVTPVKPATTTPEQPPAQQQPPRLGQILSAEQTRDYNRTIDESLERVRKAVATLGRKNLSADQAEILNRIQVFQKQAEDKREQDLVIAVSLAHRADLLAKDLMDRVP
jgi:hypothetical protein